MFGSEAVGMVVDEAVQIHGGYGFVEDFPVERAYRDARINRIFEGTNEINRLLISGMLLKRSVSGALPLLDFAAALEQELSKGMSPAQREVDVLSREAQIGECLKRLAVYPLQIAVQTLGPGIEKRQEVLASVADVVMDAYALDSMIAATRQCAKGGVLEPVRVAMARAFATEAHGRAHQRALTALSAVTRGAELATHLDRIAPLVRFAPDDPIETRETIVRQIEVQGGYPIGWR